MPRGFLVKRYSSTSVHLSAREDAVPLSLVSKARQSAPLFSTVCSRSYSDEDRSDSSVSEPDGLPLELLLKARSSKVAKKTSFMGAAPLLYRLATEHKPLSSVSSKSALLAHLEARRVRLPRSAFITHCSAKPLCVVLPSWGFTERRKDLMIFVTHSCHYFELLSKLNR